jgi:hypothetical protein
MCDVSLAIAGVSAFGTLASYSGQAEQAAQAETVRRAQQLYADHYRRQVETHNHAIYKQDIEYARDLLSYQANEFERQEEWFERSVGLIRKDYLNQLSPLLLRSVEESIATQLLGEDAVRAGRRERASAAALMGERGVAGNTVDMLLGDIERQVGEALTSYDRNRVATERQLQLEALGLKARADTAINQLPLQVFQPITPPRPPAPASPIQPTAPVAQPSPMAAVGRAIGQVAGGYSDYYSLRGEAMPRSIVDTLLLRPGTPLPSRT